MVESSFVRCEMLLPIEVSGLSSWWQTMLEPTGDQVFDACGRITPTSVTDAPTNVEEARRQGFKPLVVCVDKETCNQILSVFQRQGRVVRCLVRGRNDHLIRYLLAHPSRELIQGWLGLRPVLWPPGGFRAALDAWMARDGLAAEMARRLQEGELRLDDCDWLSDSADEEENAAGPRLLEFAWRLDPEHQIRIEVDGPAHGRLRHRLRGAGADAAAGIHLGPSRLDTDLYGEAELESTELQWLGQYLGMEWQQHTDEKKFAVIQRGLEAYRGLRVRELLSWAQWEQVLNEIRGDLAVPSHALGLRGASRNVRKPGIERINPMIRPRPETSLTFDVNWDPIHGHYRPLEPPATLLVISGKQIDAPAEWKQFPGSRSSAFSRLSFPSQRQPANLRYGWSWDAETGVLTLEIEGDW